MLAFLHFGFYGGNHSVLVYVDIPLSFYAAAYSSVLDLMSPPLMGNMVSSFL